MAKWIILFIILASLLVGIYFLAKWLTKPQPNQPNPKPNFQKIYLEKLLDLGELEHRKSQARLKSALGHRENLTTLYAQIRQIEDDLLILERLKDE